MLFVYLPTLRIDFGIFFLQIEYPEVLALDQFLVRLIGFILPLFVILFNSKFWKDSSNFFIALLPSDSEFSEVVSDCDS